MRALLIALVLSLASSAALAEPSLRSAELELAAPDPELWRAQRRARFLLAIGAGLAAGSAVHVAWAARDRYCGYDHDKTRSLYAAGALGSVGVGLALGGGTWLGVSAARRGYLRANRGQRWLTAGLSFAGFAVASVLTTFVWGFDSVGCST